MRRRRRRQQQRGHRRLLDIRRVQARGTEVSIYASIRDTEADLLEESWAEFTECTGIAINYEGSGEFEAQLQVRVDGGNAPDIAFIPQPGLIKRFADAGKLKAVSADTKTKAEANYSADWLKYATVNGQLYGAPFGSNVKSFVWYSPKTFTEKGYKVPTTWDELIALSDQIAGAGGKRGARASSPVTRPAGRPPTGSRTSCCARRRPRSTTSGSTTRSRSTTRRSPRRSTGPARS